MGIADWFKRGVSEMMIARPDDAKSHVVWKHPDPTIPMKSQLTVEADEMAVFFRDGKAIATLGPGRHTLDTSVKTVEDPATWASGCPPRAATATTATPMKAAKYRR